MLLVLGTSFAAESLQPKDVKVAGALDYNQTSEQVEYTGSPRYVAFVFNGSSRDRVEATVKGATQAEVAIADGTLNILAHGSGTVSLTLPDKGPDPEAYYILFRDPDNKHGQFTVELKKLEAKSARAGL